MRLVVHLLAAAALVLGADCAVAGCLDNGGVAPAPAASSATRNLHPGPRTAYDFRGKPYQANHPTYPVVIRNPPGGTCATGYRVTGRQPRATTWRQMKNLHDGDGMLFKGTLGAVTAEWTWMDNVMDALSFPGNGSWTVRGVYARFVRDDFIENDACRPGLVEDVLVDGAFMFMSQRPGGRATCRSSETTTIRRALVRLQCMPYGDADSGQPQRSCGAGTGVGQLWKWGPNAGNVVVKDSIFLVPSRSVNGPRSMAFPRGSYTNVTLIWLGAGSYPAPLARGVRVTKDMTVWIKARAAWLAAHRCAKDGADCSFVHR